MKKTILATAIALASATAFATGQLPGNMASVGVGGSVGSAAINNSGPASAHSTTKASAMGIAVTGGGAAACTYCGGAAGGAVSGSAAIGAAKSETYGSTSGMAATNNGSFATYEASTGGRVGAGTRGVSMGAESGAATAGGIETGVDLGPNESGYARGFTASGAGNVSGVVGSKDRDYFQTRVIGPVWTAGSIDSAEMAGGSVSGAGSITGGEAENGYVNGGSTAVAGGSTNGRIVTRRGDVKLNLEASSVAGATSGGTIDGTGAGLTGAGTYSAAGAKLSGKNIEGDLYLGRYHIGEYEINKAHGEDYKVSRSDSFRVGYGDATGGAAAGSEASVIGTVQAGSGDPLILNGDD